jgi:hypothetical protein
MSVLKRELTVPGAERIWYVADAFRAGMTVEANLRHEHDRSVVPGADRRSDQGRREGQDPRVFRPSTAT